MRISPEPLELQKSHIHLVASSSEELSDEKNIFSNLVIRSAGICKKTVLPEKVSYWKKSAILKNSKPFFHGSKVYESNLHPNQFLA